MQTKKEQPKARKRSTKANAEAPAAVPAAACAPQIIVPKKEDDSFFLPYQAAWIKDGSRLKLIEKSRQIGMSWATAYALVRRKSIDTARGDAWISSRDDLQARLFKEDCNHFANILHIAATDMGLQVVDDEKRVSAYVLAMANGCRIHSMSSNPDAQAGKRGDRVLDEFALHPDPRKLWAIAYPGITWGGQLEIISTHRGSQNLFNQLIQDIRHNGNPMGISLHRVTLEDALNQGFLRKLKAKLPQDDPRQEMDEAAYFDFIRSGCIDEESFRQEYMCEPSDDASAFISYDLIDACSMPADERWELDLDPRKEYFAGMDIGRKHDLTVLFIVERDGGRRITRRMIEMKNAPFHEQAAMLDRYAVLPHVRRVCIDATGIGAQLAEEARRRHGGKVEEVVFSSGVKEDLAVTLRRCMEDGALRMPARPELVADLRKIRKSTTSAGNVRYEGERGADGHADRFWALALALHAAKPGADCGHIGVLGPSTRLRRYAETSAVMAQGARGVAAHDGKMGTGWPGAVNRFLKK